jgi:uncharacterized delta-60 repeat protein
MNTSALAVATQTDGKIVIGGNFVLFNGVTVNYVLRLNSDGTRDTAFTANTGTAFTGPTSAIQVQSDGKIVIGGNFLGFNGAPTKYIARLNSDGTLDGTFTTNNGTGLDNTVSALAVQSDGKIVICGSFTVFNGILVNRIARLNSDGTLDTAFAANTGTGATGPLSAIAVQSDGKIVLGGNFFDFNGATVSCIVRLNSDGTRDTAFTTGNGTGANTTVSAITVQSDGKIVIGGFVSVFNGTTVNRIARLNSDGTLDTAFAANTGTGASGGTNAVAIQADGKIVIGGNFPLFNGATVNRVVRLNSDGTRDTAFTTNAAGGAPSTIAAMAVQPDGKIVIVGNFLGFGGTPRSYTAKIGGDLAS